MKIGAAQIRHYEDGEKNLANIENWIRNAADQNIDILNFPETALTGYLYESFLRIGQEDLQKGIDSISRVVEQSGVSVIIGTPLWENARLFNSVTVLLKDGRKYVYHKINLVSFENRFFTPGSEILTFEQDGLKFGTIICRDQSFPELAKRIKEAGAHVLFISCATFYHPSEARLKVDKNRALPIARASENGMFVCKANSVGSSGGKINLGHSMIVGPNGVVICEAGEFQEELLSFDIDPSFDWSW